MPDKPISLPDKTCRTCVFWRRGAKPRRTESPEHSTWRPCGNTMPRLHREGGVEMPTLSKKILTAPTATCNGWAPTPEARQVTT